MLNLLISLFIINSLDVGIKFGPDFPIGNLQRFYSTSATAGIYLQMNNVMLDYSFSKLLSKTNNNENLYLHSATISYQYPFYSKNNLSLTASFGGIYNRIIREYENGKEIGSAFGLRYGFGYEKSFGSNNLLKNLNPSLVSNLYLKQIIESRSWNSTQLLSSNYLISLMFGINLRLI